MLPWLLFCISNQKPWLADTSMHLKPQSRRNHLLFHSNLSTESIPGFFFSKQHFVWCYSLPLEFFWFSCGEKELLFQFQALDLTGEQKRRSILQQSKKQILRSGMWQERNGKILVSSGSSQTQAQSSSLWTVLATIEAFLWHSAT